MICLCLSTSCAKEWLDVKSDDAFVVPKELPELQALLDNTYILSQNVIASTLEVSTDNMELTEAQWKARDVQLRNAFVWSADINEGLVDRNWTSYYGQIYYANTALEGLADLPASALLTTEGKNLAGQAYFFRAWAHFNLLQLYAKQYDPTTATTDLGIPLRKESLLTQPAVRVSVAEGYAFILDDMAKALSLLPRVAQLTTRPSGHAAHAFLARLFLQQGDYAKAKTYADSAIAVQATLLDFKNEDPMANFPFKQFNEETIFYQTMSTPVFFVNKELFNLYTDEDYRKKLFFRQSGDQIVFKGSYANAANFFAGLATDEMFLIRSECNARLGNYSQARQDLRQLLEKRYAVIPVFPVEDKLLLDFILTERRKELLYRGLRWLDLRRLNREEDRKVTLIRDIGGTVYRLMPNSSKYVFPIPDDVMGNNPGMQQNNREE